MKERLGIFLTYLLVNLAGLAVVYYFNQENSHPKFHHNREVTDQVELETVVQTGDNVTDFHSEAFCQSFSIYSFKAEGIRIAEIFGQYFAGPFSETPIFIAVRRLRI